MTQDMGDNSGSKAAPQAPTDLGRSGYDPGRIVQHKTGGPKMVVVNEVNGGYYCQYFDLLGRAQTSYFLAHNLQLLADPVDQSVAG